MNFIFFIKRVNRIKNTFLFTWFTLFTTCLISVFVPLNYYFEYLHVLETIKPNKHMNKDHSGGRRLLNSHVTKCQKVVFLITNSCLFLLIILFIEKKLINHNASSSWGKDPKNLKIWKNNGIHDYNFCLLILVSRWRKYWRKFKNVCVWKWGPYPRECIKIYYMSVVSITYHFH